MKKAVFISLLVFVAVMLLSSCTWMFKNFNLNGKWWLTVETIKVNDGYGISIGSYTETEGIPIEITHTSTHLVVEVFNLLEGFEEFTMSGPLILEGTINNQSFQTSFATSVTISSTPDDIPATLTFSLDGDVITKDYIRAYFVINISGEFPDIGATSIDFITMICNGSRLDWGKIF